MDLENKLESIELITKEIREEQKQVRVDLRDYKHETNNRLNDMVLQREVNKHLYVLKSDTYTRTELDRVCEVIANNTESVKEMLDKHGEEDIRRFTKIEDKLDGMRNTAFDKVVQFLIGIVLWAIGAGSTWLLFVLQHKMK